MNSLTRMDFPLIAWLFSLKICYIDEFDMEIILIAKKYMLNVLEFIFKIWKIHLHFVHFVSSLGDWTKCFIYARQSWFHCSSPLPKLLLYLWIFYSSWKISTDRNCHLCLFHNFVILLCFILFWFLSSVLTDTTLIWMSIVKVTEYSWHSQVYQAIISLHYTNYSRA